ncbi:transposable element Tcb2 transposase [Trichonephila clavipes]|nr:transposable element Tcb2 transposase [Trichonephila clavipes]
MDDNCMPHRANLVKDFFFEEGIVRMEWPACSPDMNPIEHVWDALGRRVACRQPPPKTLQELERALLEEWDRIPQLVINSLIDSMPQSCGCSCQMLIVANSWSSPDAIEDSPCRGADAHKICQGSNPQVGLVRMSIEWCVSSGVVA